MVFGKGDEIIVYAICYEIAELGKLGIGSDVVEFNEGIKVERCKNFYFTGGGVLFGRSFGELDVIELGNEFFYELVNEV